jgi:arsenite methyltransferase
MSSYLSYTFHDSPEFINTFDEAPLWSAQFGLLMLKHLELKRGMTVLDIGSGAGFPLMELAGRLGPSSKLYGLDPWKNANERARQKTRDYGLTNVEIIEGKAENIPLKTDSIDLVISNLGINNFGEPEAAFHECFRVLKPDGVLVLTTNLNGHWKQFYTVFEQTLRQLGKDNLVDCILKEQEHRGTLTSVSSLFTESGFILSRYYEETMKMKFLDGTAFLNHHFIKLGWLDSWKELFPAEMHEEIFSALENNLNIYAERHNGLKLSVPMAYVEGRKTDN